MKRYQLFSRRDRIQKVDFRPDLEGSSPFSQLKRLSAYLNSDIAGADDITDCDDAVHYLREYTYRKIFTGTSHDEFVDLDRKEPWAIDWLIAVHETESEHFRQNKHR